MCYEKEYLELKLEKLELKLEMEYGPNVERKSKVKEVLENLYEG